MVREYIEGCAFRAILKAQGKLPPATRPKAQIRNDGPWDARTVPGYLEMDTVAHRGDAMTGSFISSLTAAAIAGKSAVKHSKTTFKK